MNRKRQISAIKNRDWTSKTQKENCAKVGSGYAIISVVSGNASKTTSPKGLQVFCLL